ncbi:LysE family translocator [Roseovarius sp. CAU 1744]|uniref:LysE family translocator n=1 Tax=Roseovarius sp. CAU 1744 TaxID=3140368 RepID=UPI00325BA1CB
MPQLTTLLLFLSATFVLLVVPGPTIALIISKSVAQGRKVALPMIAGIAIGGAVAATLALAGVSALLLASSSAFKALKIAGALYLFYLGFKLLMTQPKVLSATDVDDTETPFQSFRDGFLVMLFNPKGILFFAAFVPQFIDPTLPYVSQAGVLIALFVLTGMFVDTGYALLASKAGDAINTPKLQVGISRVAGLTIIGAGFVTLLSKRPQL